MNVLLVVTGLADKYNPSGSSYNNRFALGLKEKGINVVILHLRALSPKRLPIKFRKMEGNIDVIECSTFLLYNFKKMPLFVPFIQQLQLRLIKRYIQDIEVVHAISGGAVASSYIISKYLKVPMISQFIGSDISIQASYYKRKKLFNRGVRSSNYLCFNSAVLLNDFERIFDVTNEKCVLYRGINLKEFQYSINNIKDEIVVLFLGGFPVGNDNLKGGITLLKAIDLLKDSSLERKVEIRIGGPNSLSKDFTQSINQNLNNKNIHIKFIGSVQRDQVIAELEKSNIVLIPSLSEGIPNVLFEAMASGNAIIASRVGGIPEFLNDSTGILINSNDAVVLFESIEDLVSNDKLMKALAASARQKIELYSYDNFLYGYVALYQNGLSK